MTAQRDDTRNGYQVVQCSALGRRPVRHLIGTIVGGLYEKRADAEAEATALNGLSTGEVYEVDWYIGIPRTTNTNKGE